MSLLNEQDRVQLIEVFEELDRPVNLIVFTRSTDCPYCDQTKEIAEEIVNLSDKLTLQVYDFEADQAAVEQYNIDKVPATVISEGGPTGRDFGIRYYGIPSGYEFSSLISDVIMVSQGDPNLSPEMTTWLENLSEPIHMQVFVTPSCPYCPPAVTLAHRLAMASDMVKADMVEATEFPELSTKYRVMGVPRTVINENIFQEGSVPEHMLLQKLKEAVAA